MQYYPWAWSFFGMNFLWWMFWLTLVVAFFALMIPRSRPRRSDGPGRAFEILQRRYAAGELSTAEYEERKARLLRDRASAVTTRSHDLPPGQPLPQS